MKETLFCGNGQDETRVRRAFGWIVTFRDFPTGSYQTVDGDSMMADALTYFTKGRAEFFLDGVQRGDRVPGILSSEHEVVGQGGTFLIKYVEPTTRVCIPRNVAPNRGKLPVVTQLALEAGQQLQLARGFRGLVCLGTVQVGERTFKEESTFEVTSEAVTLTCTAPKVLLLDFTNAGRP